MSRQTGLVLTMAVCMAGTGPPTPLAAIGPLCGFIGLSILGVGLPILGRYRVPCWRPASRRNPTTPRHLNWRRMPPRLHGSWAYSKLPWLAILALLAALYSLYLLYIGLPLLMEAPPERAGTYTLAIIGVAIGIVIGTVATAVMPTPGFSTSF